MYVVINDPFKSFYSIKQDISKKNNCFLIYKNNILEDHKTPFDYNIKKNTKIQIISKKKGGTTFGNGLKIFFFVIIFFIYLFFLVTGIFPLISFIISNLLIVGLKKITEFLRNLTDENNWINSFLHVIQTIFIPFIQFILEYGGLFIFTFLLTFFSIYKLYYFKKEGDLSVKNKCNSFNSAKTVGGIIALCFCMFYFIVNLPIAVTNIIATFVPYPINPALMKLVNFLSRVRMYVLNFFGPAGDIEIMIINLLRRSFNKLNDLKDYDADLLYNWSKTYQMTKTYPMSDYIKKAGLEEVMKEINFAELKEENKQNKEIPCLSLKRSGFAYFLRSIYDNSIFTFLKFINILDICGPQKGIILDLQNQRDSLKQSLNNIEKSKKTNNKTSKSINIINENIKKLDEMIEKSKNTKLLNVPCLMNIVTNGAIIAIPITLLFVILFFVFLFKNI